MSYFPNSVVLWNIFSKVSRKKLNLTEMKKLINKKVFFFLLTTKKIEVSVTLTLRVSAGFFSVKRHCVAYIKNKYKNQTTSNDGEIDLNMGEKSHFMLFSCFCDLDL